jgi:hypothetical protein
MLSEMRQSCQRVGRQIEQDPPDRRLLLDLAATLRAVAADLSKAINDFSSRYGSGLGTLQAEAAVAQIGEELEWIRLYGRFALTVQIRDKLDHAHRRALDVVSTLQAMQPGEEHGDAPTD